MANIHFIGGEKGGVGKSVTARLLAQYLIDHGLPFIGFDTDRSHGSFQRFYSGYASPVVVDDFAGLDAIVAAVAEVPDRHVIVDLAAQTLAPLSRWMDESGVVELLGEMGTGVRGWHVLDDGMDSLGLLPKAMAAFGAKAAHTVVLNHGRGSDFAGFHASEAKAQALAAGATVLELRRLHEASMHKIDQHNASFWAATNPAAGAEPILGLLERQRVRIWLRKSYEDLAAILGTP